MAADPLLLEKVIRCISPPLRTVHSDIVSVAGLQYRKAHWPRRILARVIDIILLTLVCTIAGESFLPLTIPLAIVYLFIGNALFRGASIGKRMAGLKIIDAKHGGPCGFIQDFFRHRYLFFTNPIFLLLTAYDAAQGHFDKSELYIVHTAPPTSAELERVREKPAKLDLAGMRASLQKPESRHDDPNNCA